MDNLLLHIGYHKTATTWFQTQLFTSSSDVFEPLSRSGSHQSTLAMDFFKGRDGYLLPSFSDNHAVISSELSGLQKAGPGIGSKIPVISHERLSGNPHAGGFDSQLIANRLAKVFPSARVFIVIREQEAAVLSSYLQFLKGGGTQCLDSYLNAGYDGKIPGFSPHHFSYLGLIEEYARLFGNDRVLVLPYEMFSRDPESFFTRFGGFLGHSFDVDSLPLATRVHEREDIYLAYRLRGLNRYMKKSSLNAYSSSYSPRFAAVATAIVNKLAQVLPGSLDASLKQKLEAQVSAWAGDRYACSNTQLSRAIGVDLGTFGYRVDS